MNTLAPRNPHAVGRARRALRAGLTALAVTAGGAFLALGMTAPAHAAGAEVTASPNAIAVGGTTTITATGLGGLATAGFGLSDTTAGTFTQNNEANYEATVTNGTATATFKAAKQGTVTIAVGTGESVLGTVQVTVNGNAPAVVSVTAGSDSIQTGATTTITATGLGGIQTASFGLNGGSGGTFEPGGQSSAQVTVSNGTATATFSSTEAGTFTIAVGDGETVLGTTTVTVTAATPTPTPTPTPTVSPTPAPTASGLSTAALVGIIAAIIVVIAAAAVTGALVARARAKRAVQGRSGDDRDPQV